MDTHQVKRTACMVTRRGLGLSHVADPLSGRRVVNHANNASAIECDACPGMRRERDLMETSPQIAAPGEPLAPDAAFRVGAMHSLWETW
ncbi:hypothetical protein [Streptomyces sp. OE57]|uniref:hypothetical protein n=1 Tax=Streptomyces lacaronensis TaxID=3379885 RepID=UPI0039B750D5